MIKHFCDSCASELTADLPGYQDLDTFAVEGQDSVHFHIVLVDRSLIYCRDCFDALLLDSLNLEMERGEEEQEQKEAETDRALGSQEEDKPSKPGSWLGQKSPGGEWSWQGTGDVGDDWERIDVRAYEEK